MRTSNIQHRSGKKLKKSHVQWQLNRRTFGTKVPAIALQFRVHSWFEISRKESALRGRIALPCEEEATPSSIRNPLSTIGNLAGFASIRVHSWFEISRKESALRGRIALPCEEEVTSSSIRNPLSTIGNLAGFVSIRVHSWFEISPKESALRGRIALPEISPKKDRAVLQRRGLNFCSN
jgi:hypothetical protein